MGLFDRRITGNTTNDVNNRFHKSPLTVSQTPQPRAGQTSHAQGINFYKGQILKGEIIDLRGHDIKVLLAEGNTLSGSLDSATALSIGDTASFQVSEATPSSVMLKVIAPSQNTSEDSTIDKALEAASLPKTERNVTAVRELLNQGLSIDKHSITNLLKQSAMFRGVSFQALTMLMKYRLPLNEVNTTQMDSYLNYEHRLAEQSKELIQNLMTSLADSIAQGNNTEAAFLNHHINRIFFSGIQNPSTDLAPGNTDLTSVFSGTSFAEMSALDNDGMLALAESLESFGMNSSDVAGMINGTSSYSEVVNAILETAQAVQADTPFSLGDAALSFLSSVTPELATESLAAWMNIPTEDASELMARLQTFSPADASNALSLLSERFSKDAIRQLADTAAPADITALPLNQVLNALPNIMQTPEILSVLTPYIDSAAAGHLLTSFLSKSERMRLADAFRGKLPATVTRKLESGEISAAKLMSILAELPDSSSDSSYAGSEAYRKLLYEALTEAATLAPEDLTKDDALEQFYRTLDSRLSKLEKLSFGDTHYSFSDTAAWMRDNIDFMKTLNTLYPYIQLPLRLSHQNAHAELFVYPKQKTDAAPDDTTRLLLHLDMEQLGPLDIQLSLTNRHLNATFYLSDAEGEQITSDNLSILSTVLESKGFTLSAKVASRKEADTLLRDMFTGTGKENAMKRYSFDIRA